MIHVSPNNSIVIISLAFKFTVVTFTSTVKKKLLNVTF